MSLRELIKHKHDKAEHHRFVKYLFSGSISPNIYATYLYNQSLAYKALEDRANDLGLLDDFLSIQRYEHIVNDLQEFNYPTKELPSTTSYISYVANLPSTSILSHVYVRHMGDMFGGAMLKKVVPGSGTMYDFENRSELIQLLRAKLDDSMSPEANVVFDFVIQLYEELSLEYDIQ